MIVAFCLGMTSPTAFSQVTENRTYRSKQCEVLTGIDVLQREQFKQLDGQRVGLITNHTGINRDWISTVQLLSEAKNVQLVTLFSPEHGFEGKLDVAKINDARDAGTGLKIHSLYGKTRIPTDEMLKGIDTLVFDIQDIGTRFYTYISTMGNVMQAAANNNIRVVILDRPNPINGMDVQGPVLDAGSESFVGYHRIAVRHGMTTGELARMFNAELKLNLDLKIIKIEGWHRNKFFDATGLPWINPSPNMRCLTQALLYPGVGLLETTNLSVGRGTDTPFEIIGAPYIDGVKLAHKLNAAGLAGIRFVPIRLIPDSSKFKNEQCGGVNFVITNRKTFHPLKTGLELAHTLRLMYPKEWKTDSLNRLLCHKKTYDALRTGKSIDVIEANYKIELKDFRLRRKQYLLY
jgi:uncharacterized protein YbbC (DUF1343 family)